MAARRHPGIQENALVLPSCVTVSSRNIKAKTTDDFTFSIPKDVLGMLSDAFRKACNIPQTGKQENE